MTQAAASFGPGANAPTIAIVDAYDDPNAASDLAAYRASLSGATDPSTGLSDGAIPPLCSSSVTTGCVRFTKVNEKGGTSYPRANTGWAEEISLDLDMASAVCPDCNLVLVEASSSSMSNLAQAVTEAESFDPAVITNSYGGSEFSSETSYNSVYAATPSTALTVATGDNGYSAEFPAASPGVTAVGGTSLTFTGSSTNPAWSQSVWSGAGSGCSADEAMPSWQQPAAYSSSSVCTGRQIGDLAAVADPSTGVATYDTYGQSGWLVFGGTSASTQIVGAAYGLAAASGTARTKASELYVDANGTTGPTPGLVPVTSGSNGSCGGSYLCDAGASLSSGYNGPTGLGTLSGLGALEGSTTSTTGALSFSPASATASAGTPTGPIAVDLSTPAPSAGLALTVSTSSASGGFSTSSTGPFSSTLTLTIAGGNTTSPPLYYEDTTAGTPTLAASASGWSGATMSVTVDPGPLATMQVTVTAGTVSKKGRNYHVPLTVTASSASGPLGGAAAALDVYAGKCTSSGAGSGSPVASGSGTTGTDGTVTFTFKARQVATYCAVVDVTDSGYSPASGSTTFGS